MLINSLSCSNNQISSFMSLRVGSGWGGGGGGGYHIYYNIYIYIYILVYSI